MVFVIGRFCNLPPLTNALSCAVTLVGLMESIAIAKALADRNGYTLNANQELISELPSPVGRNCAVLWLIPSVLFPFMCILLQKPFMLWCLQKVGRYCGLVSSQVRNHLLLHVNCAYKWYITSQETNEVCVRSQQLCACSPARLNSGHQRMLMMDSISYNTALGQQDANFRNSPLVVAGLGIANLSGSCFSSYPTTGSFSRSAVANDTGAKTSKCHILCFVSTYQRMCSGGVHVSDEHSRMQKTDLYDCS